METIRAINIQARVISALTLHETRARYGDSKLGFFWALFEPFAHIIVFIGIFAAMGRAIPLGDSIGLFILTGIIPWLLYSKTVTNIMSGVKSNKALLGYPQVMPLDIVVSRIILDAATFYIVMILFIIGFYFLGFEVRIDSFTQMCSAYGLLILLATGIGLINSSIITIYPSYKSIYQSLSRPMYFISGVFFTADFLTPDIYELVDFNPILHLIEWFRSGFYPSFQSQLYEPNYAIAVCISIFAIGLFIERINSRKARQI